VGDVSATVALPGTNLQLRRHQSPTSSGEQAIPDDGSTLAQGYEERQRHASGYINTEYFSCFMVNIWWIFGSNLYSL